MRILSVLPLAVLSVLLGLAHPQPAAASDAGAPARPGTPLSASVVANAGATQRALATLRVAEQRRAQAVASRDVATLRDLISGDYYHVESSGRSRTKTEFLRLLERDEFEFRSYEVSDMEVRMLDNGRAAIVTGRFKAETRAVNRARELRGRYVRVWKLGPEGWRNTMQQSTEIRPSAVQREATAQQ